MEYAGDLIDLSTAKQREKKYSENPQFGCYMYYFVHRNRNYWYVYLSKLVLFSKRQLLLKMKCEIGDFAKQMYTFHCAFFFKYMHLNIMFYYVVYQKNQILIETKPCYSIINFNYRC